MDDGVLRPLLEAFQQTLAPNPVGRAAICTTDGRLPNAAR